MKPEKKSRKGEVHNVTARKGYIDNGDKYQAWDESKAADRRFCEALEKQFGVAVCYAKAKPKSAYNEATLEAYNAKYNADQILLDCIVASYPAEAK